jgi:hypothetical protein
VFDPEVCAIEGHLAASFGKQKHRSKKGVLEKTQPNEVAMKPIIFVFALTLAALLEGGKQNTEKSTPQNTQFAESFQDDQHISEPDVRATRLEVFMSEVDEHVRRLSRLIESERECASQNNKHRR